MNDLITQHDLDLSALDRAGKAPGTLRHYKAAILLMIASNVNPFNREQLIAYADTLPHSGKANLKAALRIMLKDYVNQAKMSNESVEKIQRFLWVVDAMNDAIRIDKQTSERTPHWLSQEQVDKITLAALNASMRDYIVIGLLLGAGLRREELETLTFDSLTQMPYGTTIKDVLVIHGKGDSVRFVPIHPELARHVREWKEQTKGGRVARRFLKGGKIGKSLSAYRIFDMVRKYGLVLGIEDLDPHDLRRSYGRLMYYTNGKDIMLVKELLGHATVKTTQIYIGLLPSLGVDVYPVGALQVAGD